MAGEPFVSNVAEGAIVANSLDPAFVVFEGSGAAMPPVGTDARLLVVGAHQPIQHITGYLGPYRLLTSDAVVVTMAEEPMASMEKVQAIISGAREIKGDLTVIPTVFRPQPMQPIKGRRVALFTTASRTQAPVLQRHLEEHFDCVVEMVSFNLSDRRSLQADLRCDRMKRVDTFLTEIKAAAIDVVAETAQTRGIEVVFVDNIPVEVPPANPGDLGRLAGHLYGLAGDRFQSREA
jgi:cyclic 2,3-diphosphoglycerate synthetase